MVNFDKEVLKRISKNKKNKKLIKSGFEFIKASTLPKYSYNFYHLGRPIIQYPQDMIAIQEIIWKVKPDLIIETGIAHGGSLILSASQLAMIDMYDKHRNKRKITRKVLGIDIDIRKQNKKLIEKHFLNKYIEMFEGSSIDKQITKKVETYVKKFSKILVLLDSNHTFDHVFNELKIYSEFVSKNSYCVVFDTIVGFLKGDYYKNRNWDEKNSPRQAVENFLKLNKKFVIDTDIDNKLIISVAPNGYLKKIK
tara:strand:+ start:1819 stop:2574 length:756 start_codon:yes stop_codon:yes gene_type:complete